MTGSLSRLALLLASTLLVSPALADDTGPAGRVRLDLEDVPLAAAVEQVAAAANRTVVVDPVAADAPARVTLKVDEPIPWREAIERVAASAGCDVTPLAGGALVVHRVPRVSLDANQADVREVLVVLAELANRALVVGPDVSGTVTVDLDDLPWTLALEAILHAARASAGALDDVVVVTAEPLEGLGPLTPLAGSAWARDLHATARRSPAVSLDLAGAPLGDALLALGDQADCDVALGQGAQVPVSVGLRRAPWRDALSILAVLSDADVVSLPGDVLALERTPRVRLRALDQDATALLLEVGRLAHANVIVAPAPERLLAAHLPHVGWLTAVRALAMAAELPVAEHDGHAVVGPAVAGDPQLPSPSAPPVTPAVDVALRSADLASAVAQLRAATGLNLLVAPGVEGAITLRMRQVPWHDALAAVARVSGCTVEARGDAFVVERPGDRAALFKRADAHQALRTLGRYAGFDVVVGGELGAVSANLAGGNWLEALQLVAAASGAWLEPLGPRLLALRGEGPAPNGGLAWAVPGEPNGGDPEEPPSGLELLRGADLDLSATLAPDDQPRCALIGGRLCWEGEPLGGDGPEAAVRLERVGVGRVTLTLGDVSFERYLD